MKALRINLTIWALLWFCCCYLAGCGAEDVCGAFNGADRYCCHAGDCDAACCAAAATAS